MKIDFIIPNSIQKALDQLMVKGFYAYIVGGCVRDSLMNKIPHDYDLCTSALPNEILDCFKDFKTIETGIKHGTVTVIIDKMPIEITSYRIETDYNDHRHPSNVCFTDDIEKDLSRRDFTINAIAYNPKFGFVDPFGGSNDIKNKTIKAVGNPYERFNEDSLRILRAVRFSSVLGFEIEKETLNAINLMYSDIMYCSKERQLTEIKKLLCGDYVKTTLENSENLITFYAKDFTLKYDYKVLCDIVSNVENDEKLRLLAFFSCFENVKLKKLSNLKFDKSTINYILSITNCDFICKSLSPIETKILLNKIGEQNLIDLIKISYAFSVACGFKNDSILENLGTINFITENKLCYCIKDLAITGADLIDMGFSKGKNIGVVLDKILNLVIYDKLKNNKTDILNYIKKIGSRE